MTRTIGWMACALAGLVLSAQVKDSRADLALQAAIKKETVDGDLKGAIEGYKKLAQDKDRQVAAKALVRMGECYEKLGDSEARTAYERVVREFGDQKEAVEIARARLGSATAQSGVTARQVWSDRFAGGGPSPDGRYMAWANWHNHGNLSIHDLVKGEDRDLTHRTDGSDANNPIFLPDGKRVMYQWYDATADEWSLRTIALDGSNERVYRVDGYPGSVSPDGRTAAIRVSAKGVQQIAVLDLASGRVIVLKSVAWQTPEIGNFSPDSRHFVYSLLTTQSSQDREVYVMATDGSAESKVVAAPGSNRNPYFSPDGSRIVFVSDRSGHWDLWSLRVANGKAEGGAELLKPEIGPVTSLGFSRDGTLFYGQQVDQSDAFTIALVAGKWVAAGTPQRVSDRNIGASATPVWSPDGKRIAYAVDRSRGAHYDGGEVTYIVRDVDSGREREFTVPISTGRNYFSRFFRWFPDGKALLLPQWTMLPHQREFLRLDLTTGKTETLFVAPWSNNLNTTFSPDGKQIFYASYREDDRRTKYLVRHDLTNGEESVMSTLRDFDGPATLHGLSMAADGRQIAFFRPISEGKKMIGWTLMVAPVSGGDPRDAGHPEGSWINPSWSAWTPDGTGVLVLAGDNNSYNGPYQMWYIPVNGGTPHGVGISMPLLESISLDPSGKRVGFTGGSSTAQIWEIKNLFPQLRASR
jgi:Tol biopolymer transport system component